jgi:magnesium chelatase family protein
MRAGRLNARLDPAATLRDCRLAGDDQHLLEQAAERLRLSARTMHLLRVARTIADLSGAADIATPHLSEALGYRGITVAGMRGAA